jgi:hypothetical protein
VIPHFKKVYTVILHTFKHATSCLMCDCKYFECNGMVCHHLAHVKMYYAAKPNITHHDVSPRWWKAHLYFSIRNDHNDCTPEERQVRIELERIRQNDCKGPSFAEKPDVHTLSPFSRVYQFGEHWNDVFRNATKHSLNSLFKNDSITHRVINYSAEEIIVAIGHSSTNVPPVMSHESHLQNGFSDDGSDIDGSDDGYNNGCLIESPVLSDRIDFGSRFHEDTNLGGNVYNAYDMIIPRAKELDSIIAASKNCRERGVAVERALDKMFRRRRKTLLPKNLLHWEVSFLHAR